MEAGNGFSGFRIPESEDRKRRARPPRLSESDGGQASSPLG